MNALVWTAFGMTFGSAVLHGTLGLRQPRDPTYVSFAWSMAAVAGFIYFAYALYTSTSVDQAVEAMRHREIMAHALIACLLVFIPVYARMRMPRMVSVLLWGGLAAMFVANIVTPYSIWLASKPTLIHATFRGAPFATVRAPPFTLLQYAYSTYQFAVFVLAVAFVVRMIRSGDRRRGVILAAATAVVAAVVFVDVYREARGLPWPFLAEYGFVGWGVIMSVQLALEYRAQAGKLANAIAHVSAQASRLTAILGSMRALEHNIDEPLHVLETGFGQLAAGSDVDPQLVRLRRAVTRLRALSNATPNLRTGPRKRN
jgi:hypothetical protein